MIYKILNREMNNLYKTIKELEIENKRIKQDLVFRSETVKDLNNANEELEIKLKKSEANHNHYKNSFQITADKLSESQKELNDLKAELTYWKETAKDYKDKFYELEQDNDYLKRKNHYLRNKLNKTVDK